MRMGSVRDWLLPGEAEQDEGFSQEILSLSHRALAIVSGVQVAVGLLAFARFVPWPAAAGLFATGVATAGAMRVPSTYPKSRALVTLSSAIGSATVSYGMLGTTSAEFGMGAVAAQFLAALSAPLLPVHALLIGAAAIAASAGHRLFLSILTMALTVMAIALYVQRRGHYDAYASVLRASHEFRALQARLLLSESSATLVRLSAALAHELATPLGALSSSVDTLLLLTSRQAAMPARRAGTHGRSGRGPWAIRARFHGPSEEGSEPDPGLDPDRRRGNRIRQSE